MFNVAEEGHVVRMLGPIDIGGAIKTSDYVSLKNYAHCNVIVTFASVTNACTFTIYESDDASGSNESLIGFDYYKSGSGDDSFSTRTTATTAGVTTTTDDNVTYVVDIDASELSDGSPFIALKTDDPGACLISAVAILSGARYGAEVTPSALS